MSIPVLIFALMLLSIFGTSVLNLIIILALLDSTRVFRLSRAVAMNVVVMDLSRRRGCAASGIGWIMLREILPNILPPMIAEFGLRFCFVFLTISALSFLGVGIQPPTADWGSMVREKQDADHLGDIHAAVAGRRHRAADGGGQFRGRLVPASRRAVCADEH